MGDYSAFSIDCPAGTVIDITAKAENTGKAIYEVGIIPSTADVNTYCSNTAFTDTNDCSSKVDTSKFRTTLQDSCVGKSSCQIT